MSAMLTIWRRHTPACPHSAKGRNYLKCGCPLWADGYNNGKRTLRKSLGTADMARARKKAMMLESPEVQIYKPVAEAVEAYLAHCQSDGLQDSTYRKYRNILAKLREFCVGREIYSTHELDLDALDDFRTGRQISPLTASKELQLLRQFCAYCVDRKWMEANPAKSIKSPRILKPNDVEPFTLAEVATILSATGRIGQTNYERLRARAMILTLRYTALRIGDVATLARDCISRDGQRWRIFLRTEKSGKPVFLPIPQEMKDALDCAPIPKQTDGESKYFFWNGKAEVKSLKAKADRTLRAVFKLSGVSGAHAHRFRHTLATDLLGRGASFEEVADVLGNSPEIVRKHYAKWSPARQERIDDLMEKLHSGANYEAKLTGTRIQ